MKFFIAIAFAFAFLTACGGSLGTAEAPRGALVFNEDFSNFEPAGTLSNHPLQCAGRTTDPDIGPAAVNIPGRWGTLAGLAGDGPLPNITGRGNKSWNTSGGVLNFRAEQIEAGGAQTDGFAFISGQTFDRSRTITAQAEFRITAAGRGAFLGLALLVSESDYVEGAYRQSYDVFGRNRLEVHRVTPCEETTLGEAVGISEWHTIRLDVEPNGRVTYTLDGEVYLIEQPGPGVGLTADPRVAIYFATGKLGAFAEGQVRAVQVWN